MQSVSYTDARDHLKDMMNRVEEEREPVRIVRRSGGSAVLISEADYCGLQETLYLLGNSVNVERLLAAKQRGVEASVAWDEINNDLGL